jgi:hypothetical protein
MDNEIKQQLDDIFERLGPWEDTRSAEEIIQDLYDSRISKSDVSYELSD